MVKILLSLLLLFPASTFGQVGNGQIQGVCQDTSGAVIPGATVTIKNTNTGTERAIVTNEVGRFVAPAMQVGTYEIGVDMPGMARLNRSGITLNVGAVVDVVLVLQPAGVQQEVSVTAASPIVESTKTDVSTTINEVAIQNLPLNGRRWENLALLTPGSTNDGTFGLVSFRGISGNFNNTMIDGADNNQSFFSESKGRTRIAYSVSQETIREFQVNTSNFSAEFGRAAGGVVNAVTQSGTNEFHGTGFYFLRDKSFLALDPFAKAQGQPKPPERRHQFGGSFGGPIVENKLFFFASYDQQNRNFPITVLPNGGERFYTGSTASAAATEASIKFLRDQTGVFPRKGNQNLVFGKIDWDLSPSNRLASSFNLLRWRSPNGIQTGAVVAVPQSSNGNDGVHDETFINTLTSVLSNRTVNEARFHYGRDLNFQSPNGKGPSVTISNGTGNSFQYGMPNFLPRPAYPNEKRFQFMENLSHVVGKHNLKFGADVNYVRTLFINLFQGGGVYAYNSLTNWILDYSGIDTGANTGKHYSSYNQAFDTRNPDGRSQFAATDFNFYAQDSYQVHPKVTLNLGVRYEYQQIPQPKVSNPALPDTATLNKDRNNWAPRFGLAWQALSKTLLRVGYGISYGRTEGSTISNFHNNNGLVQPSFRFFPATAGAPVFPNVFSSLPSGSGAVTINLASRDFVNSMIHGGNVELEHELTNNLSIAIRYLGARGTKLPTARDVNIAPATQSRTYNVLNSAGAVERTIVVPFYNTRVNPAYSALRTYETVVNSWYHAGVIQVNKRFSDGLQFMSYFQWAHALDSGQTSFTFFPTGAVLDPYNLRDDYGNSNFDQRKRFVFNGIWDVFHWTQNKAVNGFKLSGVLTLSDGFAQTGFVSVPSNLAGGLGSGLNASGATSNRFPGLGRNSFVKPGLANLDLRLAREFKFAEDQSVEFIWEAFNVANRVNYNFVNSTQYRLSGTNLTRNATFLTPQSALSFPSTGNPRQMQIALRYKF